MSMESKPESQPENPAAFISPGDQVPEMQWERGSFCLLSLSPDFILSLESSW